MSSEAVADGDLPAGALSSWLEAMQRARRGEQEMDVPCDGCTACCRSAQFIHIGPNETSTLARIPAGLLAAAPRLPRGHKVLGYDQNGHCPMLIDDRCSIYADRPRACRTYDCRVFAAAGVPIDDKPLIAERARRWRFGDEGRPGEMLHAAVRAAATFLSGSDVVPTGSESPTRLALAAIDVHHLFAGGREPSADDVRVELRRRASGE